MEFVFTHALSSASESESETAISSSGKFPRKSFHERTRKILDRICSLSERAPGESSRSFLEGRRENRQDFRSESPQKKSYQSFIVHREPSMLYKRRLSTLCPSSVFSPEYRSDTPQIFMRRLMDDSQNFLPRLSSSSWGLWKLNSWEWCLNQSRL